MDNHGKIMDNHGNSSKPWNTEQKAISNDFDSYRLKTCCTTRPGTQPSSIFSSTFLMLVRTCATSKLRAIPRKRVAPSMNLGSRWAFNKNAKRRQGWRPGID